MSETLEILERLVSFPSVSGTPNAELFAFVKDRVEAAGGEAEIVATAPDRLNLYAVFGERERAGVVLSGHMDVVPTAGQTWSADPFVLRTSGTRLYGRGTTDMKGFCAAAIAAAARANVSRLKTPLHLAFSCDEEIGCLGVRDLGKAIEALPVRPRLCWVGEPTNWGLTVAHKGHAQARVVFRGSTGHSSLAPLRCNALHLAAEFINFVRAEQEAVAVRAGSRKAEAGVPAIEDADIPYATLHLGILRGGEALNLMPHEAEMVLEVRAHAPEGEGEGEVRDDAESLLARLTAAADAIVARARAQGWGRDAGVSVETRVDFPPLAACANSEAVQLVGDLLGGDNRLQRVSFGTDAAHLAGVLGIPTVVCGPGDIRQAHTADEFIERACLERCDALLDALLVRLEAGL